MHFLACVGIEDAALIAAGESLAIDCHFPWSPTLSRRPKRVWWTKIHMN
jgi:hypothetical protein